MEAALQAGEYTDKILIVDARTEAGGNAYASIASNAENFPRLFKKLGHSYRAGLELVEQFRDRGLDYRPCTSVWHLDPDGHLACRGPNGASIIQAKKIILCTGAYERPLPIPGWTLPGVMGVGAAQIALKSSNVLPDNPAIIIGDGPLALLYAKQLRKAGGTIGAFVIPKTIAPASSIRVGALAALVNPIHTMHGLSLLFDRTLAGIEVFRDATQIQITGRDHVEAVHFEVAGEIVERLAASVLLHDGIVPDINILAGAGLDISWSDKRKYWHPYFDDFGQSSRRDILVAGDAGGISGAKAAHLSGKRAALAACVSLGLAPEKELTVLRAETDSALERETKFRQLLDQFYPVTISGTSYPDDLTICRCEAVKAGEIRREIAEMKCTNADSNRLKSILRCGMGPCQGRNCALPVAGLVADEMGGGIDLHYLPRTRAPYTPVTLGEISNLTGDPGPGIIS